MSEESKQIKEMIRKIHLGQPEGEFLDVGFLTGKLIDAIDILDALNRRMDGIEAKWDIPADTLDAEHQALKSP